MSIVCVTGIVMRCVDYRDHDRILSIFSREHGRIDAKARGCRRPKSPLLAAAQPFVYGEFELFLNKEKYTLNQCDVRETFFPLRTDLNRFGAGSCMLTLALDAVQVQEPNDALFVLLYHSLSFLAYSDADPMDLMLCFLVRYFHILGYGPCITSCAICQKDLRNYSQLKFLPMAGGAVCIKCGKDAKDISPLSLEAMRRMLLLENQDMHKVKLPESVRKELFMHLKSYCFFVREHIFRAIQAFEKLYVDS